MLGGWRIVWCLGGRVRGWRVGGGLACASVGGTESWIVLLGVGEVVRGVQK